MENNFIEENFFSFNDTKISINSISVTLKSLRNSLSSIIEFDKFIIHLQQTLIGFQFKRSDKQSFIQKLKVNNELRIDKQLNGYFIAKLAIYFELHQRIEQKRKLIILHSCSSCQNQFKWNILNTVNSIKFSSLKQNLFGNDLELQSSDRSEIFIFLTTTGKLGNIKTQRLLKMGTKIIELHINRNDSDSSRLINYSGFTPNCPSCNNFTHSEKKSHKDIKYPSEVLKKIPLFALQSLPPATKHIQSAESPNPKIIREELNSWLKSRVKDGKYQFKTLKWILTFDHYYFVKLAKKQGSEYQQSVFELLSLAQQINFEGFPELQELSQILEP